METQELLTGREARDTLIGMMPVTARRIELAGISTAVLEAGAGPPVVLLLRLHASLPDGRRHALLFERIREAPAPSSGRPPNLDDRPVRDSPHSEGWTISCS